MNYSNYSLNFDAPTVEIMSAAIAQGVIDIPSSMPLVEEIIYSHAKITDVDTTCQDQKVLINATVNFVVVYKDRDDIKHSLEAKTAFEHSMSYPSVDENMWVSANAVCSNSECRVTTASSISAQCVVEVTGWAYKNQGIMIAQAKDSQSANIQTKTNDIAWVSSLITTHSDTTIRQDIRIEDGKPEVNALLDNSVHYFVDNVMVTNGCVNITGFASVEIIYSHDLGIDKAYAKLPCDIIVENPDIIENKTVCTDIEVKYLDIKIYEDENGKRKILSLEAPIHSIVTQEVTSRTMAVSDAYSTNSNLELSYIDMELPAETKFIKKNNCQITAKLMLDNGFDSNNLYSIGHVSAETLVAEGKKLTVSGLLKLRVWGKDGRYQSSESLYSLDIIADEPMDDAMLSCDVVLKRNNIYQNNDNEWVSNAEIDVFIKAMNRQKIRAVNEIEESELEEVDKYSLMLAMASGDDTLWTLAKRCRVSIDDIMELNPGLSSDALMGSPVIIYKK